MHQSIFNRYQARHMTAGILAVASAIFASVLMQTAQAQNSPVGSWDLTLGNAKRGNAVIVFNSDFTMEGYEVTSAPRSRSGNSDLRDGRPQVPRNEDDGSDSGDASGVTVGSAEIAGVWTYDQNGRVIGFFDSFFASGGGEGEEVTLSTNAVSFRALVRPGRRINIMASTVDGRAVYRGNPSTPVDISGDYFSIERKVGGSELIQFVSLTPGILPNEFNVVGTGPGYSFFGSVIVSPRGQISYVRADLDGTFSAAATGRFNFRRMSARLRGTDAIDESIRIEFSSMP